MNMPTRQQRNLRISDSNTATNKRFDDLRDLINSNARHSDRQFDLLNSKLDRIADALTAGISDHKTGANHLK